jgi:hypothetical protein
MHGLVMSNDTIYYVEMLDDGQTTEQRNEISIDINNEK